jgi:uncharacterized membrane protein YvbJ
MDTGAITCPECGTENTPDAEKCTNCGMSLDPAEEGVEPQKGQNEDPDNARH